MYQMYPEWGPARHRHDDTEPMAAPSRRPRYWERELVATSGASKAAAASTTGSRDADGDRPDDN